MSKAILFTDELRAHLADYAKGQDILNEVAQEKTDLRVWQNMLHRAEDTDMDTWTSPKSGITFTLDANCVKDARKECELFGKRLQNEEDEGKKLQNSVLTLIPDSILISRAYYRSFGNFKGTGAVVVNGKRENCVKSYLEAWQDALVELGAKKVDSKTTEKWLVRAIAHTQSPRISKRNWKMGKETANAAKADMVSLLLNMFIWGFELPDRKDGKTKQFGEHTLIVEGTDYFMVRKDDERVSAFVAQCKEDAVNLLSRTPACAEKSVKALEKRTGKKWADVYCAESVKSAE